MSVPKDAKMQDVGESLTTVGCSASIISRSHWFWGNFNTGKTIHPAKDFTMEAGAMDEISVSHHWAMKFRADITVYYRYMLYCYMNAELQV